MQLRTDATGAVLGRGAKASASTESSEEDRDSTPVVPFTGVRHGRDGRDPTVCRSSSNTVKHGRRPRSITRVRSPVVDEMSPHNGLSTRRGRAGGYTVTGPAHRQACRRTQQYPVLNRNSAHDITIVFGVTDKESFSNVKTWTSKIDKRVSDGINKLLVENECDLTSQEKLPTGEAKSLANSLRRSTRVRRAKNPRRSMSRRPCPESLVRVEGG